MELVFIDESGSMTTEHCMSRKYFVICMLKVTNPDALAKAFKRFVSSNFKELQRDDVKSSMFLNGKFKELKGNSFSPELKRKFVDYFCRNNYFEVYYIVVSNEKVANYHNGKLYKNTARAFNYLLKTAFAFYTKHGYFGREGIALQLDERNESPDSKHFLKDFLNTELVLNDYVDEEFSVSYFDSSKNIFIQLADVFANIKFSDLMTDAYGAELEYMEDNGYLKHVFRFPL